MVTSTDLGPAPVFGLLDRHEQRRGIGMPTVSVLAGPVGLAVRIGRQWAATRDRPIIQVEAPDREEIVNTWVEQLARERGLVQDAIGWLARQLGRPADQLGLLIGRKTPYELAGFLETALPVTSQSGVESVCRRLLERSVASEWLNSEKLALQLDAVLSDRDGRSLRVILALRELLLPGCDPILLLAHRAIASEPESWAEPAARLLTELAMAQPKLSLILGIDPGELDAYNRLTAESRAKALLREAVIPIPSLGADGIRHRLDDAIPDVESQLAGPIRRLAIDGASVGLVHLFREAILEASAPEPIAPARDERARSAAERFLFERLESLPETTGLFQLNAALGFRFGPAREMEVDLVARALGLVVEVDGYYHFRDADAYRRDRRKDLELQKRGFLVVRVLADDVVRRLEDVLDMILAAVAFRRDQGDRRRGKTP